MTVQFNFKQNVPGEVVGPLQGRPKRGARGRTIQGLINNSKTLGEKKKKGHHCRKNE